MPMDMYPSADGADMAENDAPGSAEDQGKDNNAPESTTTLVDKNIFPETPEPDQICQFKVVKVYEKEVELEYQKEGQKPPSEMDGAEDKLDAMAGANAAATEGA